MGGGRWAFTRPAPDAVRNGCTSSRRHSMLTSSVILSPKKKRRARARLKTHGNSRPCCCWRRWPTWQATFGSGLRHHLAKEAHPVAIEDLLDVGLGKAALVELAR